jgi:pilus assembly protein Flp/PilA
MLDMIMNAGKVWRELTRDVRAVTAMEYALIGSLIAVAIIAAVGATGTSVGSVFNTLAGSL